MAIPSFVDRVTVHVTAGKGGNGCASVNREKFKPLGGPDGGNGGSGGAVVLVVGPGVHHLLDFPARPLLVAGRPPRPTPPPRRPPPPAGRRRKRSAEERRVAKECKPRRPAVS